jgi:hypothetical protein
MRDTGRPNQAGMERYLVLFCALIRKVVHIRTCSSDPSMEPLVRRTALPWQRQDRA